jgi:hypothetical protein
LIFPSMENNCNYPMSPTHARISGKDLVWGLKHAGAQQQGRKTSCLIKTLTDGGNMIAATNKNGAGLLPGPPPGRPKSGSMFAPDSPIFGYQEGFSLKAVCWFPPTRPSRTWWRKARNSAKSFFVWL